MQIVVQDLLVHYETSGKGKAILLLHGWGDDGRTFTPILDSLAQNFTVITVDLPGFGQTDTPKKVWNLDDYARFTADFIQKILSKESPLAIIGHSNGGAIAIRGIALGLLAPGKLILLASSGVRDSANARRLVIKLVAKTGKGFTFWLPKRIKERLQKKLYGIVGSDMLVAPHLQETFKQSVRQDIQMDAADINIPTLLVYGDQDSATPVALVGEKLHHLIKTSELKVIPGASHFVHQIAPKQTTDYIMEFLN